MANQASRAPSGELPKEGSPASRWSEPAKFLPIGFVVANISILYFIYMCYYIWPLYNDPTRDPRRVWFEAAVFNYVTAMMFACYIRCIFTHPGTVPGREADASWQYPQDGGSISISTPVAPGCGASEGSRSGAALLHSTTGALVETKRSGDRRHCKWCAKYKPDRCHHCRVCRMCILKMDHHCPWIYNCVGFKNHKYFILLFLHAMIACHLITWTMLGTLRASTGHDTPFLTMFFLLFGETLAAFLGILVTPFFWFHIWLTYRAMTTIEFCEKACKRSGYDASTFDRGTFGNFKAVFGDIPATWFFPICTPSGDGLTFQSEEMRLVKDVEAGRSLRRRAHATGQPQPQQRQQWRPPRHHEVRKAAGTGSAPASDCGSGGSADGLEGRSIESDSLAGETSEGDGSRLSVDRDVSLSFSGSPSRG